MLNAHSSRVAATQNWYKISWSPEKVNHMPQASSHRVLHPNVQVVLAAPFLQLTIWLLLVPEVVCRTIS